jgi:hypothetical protein
VSRSAAPEPTPACPEARVMFMNTDAPTTRRSHTEHPHDRTNKPTAARCTPASSPPPNTAHVRARWLLGRRSRRS